DIGIQVPNQIKAQRLEAVISRVEAVGLCSELAVTVLRHAYQLNPVMLADIGLHDLVGPIGRTIAHDNPPRPPPGLSDHRTDGILDERLLVPRRCDQYIREAAGAHDCGWLPAVTETVLDSLCRRCANALNMVPCPQWNIGVLIFLHPRSR